MGDEATGLFRRVKGGSGYLITPSIESERVLVPSAIARGAGLVPGARVTGILRDGSGAPELASIREVGGLAPAAFRARPTFGSLTAIDPADRFHLEASGELAMRIVDLIAPIGKGTRGLIVAPPKAGKTTLLEQIAVGIRADEPEARIVVLLIDERPEEVTYFRRAVQAEVFASSIDRPVREHTELLELMLGHITVELECGRDVVVLLDSLTRLARAFNKRAGVGASRTLSGGMDAGALEMPRRFFGLARNIEGGGSVTIIATALIDTGSRMDQVIYEEFKGTGNSEIVLSRALAEERIFPAIDLVSSGTRKEALLYTPDEVAKLNKLRRALTKRDRATALSELIQLLKTYPDNAAFLKAIPAMG